MPIRDDSQQQTASRQHPVPQNVMDVEFKVVGDLTVRQLMYLFAGGTLIYIFHKSGLPGFWRVILMMITGIISIAVAFVPIQERGLDKWLVSFIRAMTTPSQRVWRKSYSPPAYFISDYAQIIKNEIITLTPAKSRSKLDDYLGQLPEYQTDLDKLEFSRIKDIQSGFARPMSTNIPEPILQPSPNLFENLAEITTTIETEIEEITTPEIIVPPIKKDEGDWLAFEEEKEGPTPDEIKKENEKKKAQEKEALAKKKALEDALRDEMATKVELLKAIEKSKPTFKTQPIDRAIVNIPKELKGEIRIKTTTKLPKTIVFQDIKSLESKEDSLSKKVAELLAVTRQVRSEMQQNIAQGVPIENVKNEQKDRIEFFKNKYEELQTEQAKISSQIDKSNTRVEQVSSNKDQDELKTQVKDLMEKNEELKMQLEQIKLELKAIKTPLPERDLSVILEKTEFKDAHEAPSENPIIGHKIVEKEVYHEPNTVKKVDPSETHVFVQTKNTNVSIGKSDTPNAPHKKSLSPFQYDPNVVHGIVKNKDGGLLEGAVVIIKDKEGDAIRALKTNQLGQFKTQTPLQNGFYTVEAIKGGSKFDIISVEAKGEQLNELQMIAYA